MAEDIDKKEIGKAVLNIFGKETVIKLMAEIRKLDKVASGELIKSLDWRLKNFVSYFNLDFEAAEHAIYVLQGRKPGKFVPVANLNRWLAIRGIPLKYSYPINLKIYKFGIRPSNFINDVINESTINDLVHKLEDNYASEIENQIEKFFYEKP